VQLRAGVGVDGSGVEVHGVHQRHREPHRGPVVRQAFWTVTPDVVGRAYRTGQASEIVEADRRVGFANVDVVGQIAQQTVGQTVRKRPKLLLGVLEHRSQ
jgi:hypothetical protein